MDHKQPQSRGASAGDDLVAAARELSATLSAGASARDLQRIIPTLEANLLRQCRIQTARVPREFGGPEVSFIDFAEIMLELGKGDPNVAQSLQPHFVLMDWLKIEGSAELQRRVYRQVLDGAIITNAVGERGTKTPGDFAATLQRSGDGYVLNGSKFYCTGSLIADGLYVLAVLDDGGKALAIVPKDRAGVEITDDWDGMGQRTTGSGTIRLDSVHVDAGEVMVLSAWGVRRSYLGAASQVAHAAIDAGICFAALDDAIKYAQEKARPVYESGVDRATDDHYVLHAVGEMSVIANSAKAMVLRAGNVLDRATSSNIGGAYAGTERAYVDASIAVAEAKAASNDASLRVSEMIYRVAGASATLRKYNLDRHWRNARTHTTHDPVSYKHRAIGEYLLNGKPPPVSTKI